MKVISKPLELKCLATSGCFALAAHISRTMILLHITGLSVILS